MFNFCFHKYKDVKTQISKGMCFGFGEGSPGMRLIRQCTKCNKKKYIKLNLFMHDEFLYNEKIWR